MRLIIKPEPDWAKADRLKTLEFATGVVLGAFVVGVGLFFWG
ncbi:hypothetical protein [uncultured Brevundimonas sp.]|tara:strand:+ start:92645 stop:92770 length:126 start_codon:yes stop_codon:yes gene_type:complete